MSDEQRILVVDDDTDIRLVLGLQLRRYGWIVREASTGEEALERVRGEDFDLVVLDHRMPGTWGLSVARRMREDGFGAPILMFSAYLGPEVEVEASRLDLVTFTKTSTDELIDAINARLLPRSLWRRFVERVSGPARAR